MKAKKNLLKPEGLCPTAQTREGHRPRCPRTARPPSLPVSCTTEKLRIPQTGTLLEHVRAGKTLSSFKVIDVHAHIGFSSDFYWIPRNSPEELVRYMDRIGVDQIVAFTIAVSSDVEVGNRHIYGAAKKFPDRILPLTMLHAGFPQDWKAILRNGERNSTRGIKLISAYQRTDEMKIDWSPALDYASGKSWIVLNHSWGSPERLAMWAEKFPSVTFLIGHPPRGYEDVVRKYPNVYMTTCASFVLFFCPSVAELWRSLPVEKILLGSDCQDLDFCTAIGELAYSHEIPETDKRRILGLNAEALFKKLGWKI